MSFLKDNLEKLHREDYLLDYSKLELCGKEFTNKKTLLFYKVFIEIFKEVELQTF